MVKEAQGTQETPNLDTPEKFIRELYNSIQTWLIEDQGGKEMFSFGASCVQNWDSHEADPGRTINLSADIKNAIVAADSKKMSALVLSVRSRSKYDRKGTLGVQFGFYPIGDRLPKKPDLGVEDLKGIVDQHFFSYGSGEFFIHSDLGTISVNCWADDYSYGGKRLSGWEKKDLTSERGLEACMEMVKRVAKNAFQTADSNSRNLLVTH